MPIIDFRLRPPAGDFLQTRIYSAPDNRDRSGVELEAHALDARAELGTVPREAAATLRAETLTLVGDGAFSEYYEPVNGEALGSRRQSWTAAVILDWLDG